MKTLCVLLTAVLLAADPAPVLFEAAKKKEVVDGDLKGAIKQYGEIASRFAKTDRAVAASALVRMAECHGKLGDAEAQKIYQRVVKEFGDQKDAVALAHARMGGSAQPGRQTLTLVWNGAKTGADGSISPDGKYLSYTDWDTGDLALHPIAGGGDIYLTRTGNSNTRPWGDFADISRISRDGTQVAYGWFNSKNNRAELRIANLHGGAEPRRVFDDSEVRWIQPHDWSPDGKTLAVEIKRGDQSRQIGLLSTGGGSLRILKSLDWLGSRKLYFSPDGKYLAYELPQSGAGQQRDIFLIAIDGSQESRAVTHPADDAVAGWSPDGRLLLFTSDRSGSVDLWAVPVRDGNVKGAPELLRMNLPARAWSLGVTRSGGLFYGVVGSQDRFRIRLTSFDFSTGKVGDASDLTQDYLESALQPEWSPDGKYIAYKSVRGPAQKPTHEVVVVRDVHSGQAREVRPKLTYFGPMVWAPDGRSFLTLGGDLRASRGIYRVDIESGEISAYLKERPGEITFYPRWAPDGKAFYFRRDFRATKDSAYIRYDIATGTESELIRRRVLSMVNLSPDGNYFASRSVDESTNSRTMLLITADGRHVKELLRYPSEVGAADLTNESKGAWFKQGEWAPDSRTFLANKVSTTAGLFPTIVETWQVPIDGSAPKKLENSFPEPGSLRRDGRVAYTVRETAPRKNPEVWLLENFLPTGR